MLFYKIVLCILVTIIMLLGFSKALAQDKPLAYSPTMPVDARFEAIAHCESNGDLRAKNRYSTASGEFQFIWGTWNHYGKELWGDDFYEKNIWSSDNRELAWYVYQKYGTKDWSSSSKCWSKPVVDI